MEEIILHHQREAERGHFRTFPENSILSYPAAAREDLKRRLLKKRMIIPVTKKKSSISTPEPFSYQLLVAIRSEINSRRFLQRGNLAIEWEPMKGSTPAPHGGFYRPTTEITSRAFSEEKCGGTEERAGAEVFDVRKRRPSSVTIVSRHAG